MKVWENAIKDFSYYLRIERGLSENTAVSYSSDLEKLAVFAAAQEIQIVDVIDRRSLSCCFRITARS